MLTSKFTNSIDPGDPNASGNGRKHIIRAVEASLRRLGTDYLDLYLLHTWDRITPVEEVVRTLDDLVRAGKYQCAAGGLDGAGRLTNPGAGRAPVTEREWQIIETLGSVATGLGRPMAQVAINWVATQPGVGSVVLGASSAAQVQSNLAALDFEIPADARRLLDEASATPPGLPYAMFTPEYQSWIVSPGLGIGDKPVGYHRPVLNAPLTSRS